MKMKKIVVALCMCFIALSLSFLPAKAKADIQKISIDRAVLVEARKIHKDHIDALDQLANQIRILPNMRAIYHEAFQAPTEAILAEVEALKVGADPSDAVAALSIGPRQSFITQNIYHKLLAKKKGIVQDTDLSEICEAWYEATYLECTMLFGKTCDDDANSVWCNCVSPGSYYDDESGLCY
jgi:hypothetical protein